MNKTGRRLVKLTDIIIVFAIALVSVFLIFFNGRKTDKPTAVITVDGKEVNRIDLASAEDEVFTLNTKPVVTLEIKDNKIRFINSLCPDNTCEKCGFLESTGDTAACVPASVVITIQGENSSDNLDAVAG